MWSYWQVTLPRLSSYKFYLFVTSFVLVETYSVLAKLEAETFKEETTQLIFILKPNCSFAPFFSSCWRGLDFTTKSISFWSWFHLGVVGLFVGYRRVRFGAWEANKTCALVQCGSISFCGDRGWWDGQISPVLQWPSAFWMYCEGRGGSLFVRFPSSAFACV